METQKTRGVESNKDKEPIKPSSYFRDEFTKAVTEKDISSIQKLRTEMDYEISKIMGIEAFASPSYLTPVANSLELKGLQEFFNEVEKTGEGSYIFYIASGDMSLSFFAERGSIGVALAKCNDKKVREWWKSS